MHTSLQVKAMEFHEGLETTALYSAQRRRVHYSCASGQLRRTRSQASGVCLNWLTVEGKGMRMLPLPCHSLRFILLPPCHSLPWVKSHLKLNQQVLQCTHFPHREHENGLKCGSQTTKTIARSTRRERSQPKLPSPCHTHLPRGWGDLLCKALHLWVMAKSTIWKTKRALSTASWKYGFCG